LLLNFPAFLEVNMLCEKFKFLNPEKQEKSMVYALDYGIFLDGKVDNLV